MKLQLYLLTAVIGLVLAVHLAMNSQMGQIMQNPRMSNAIFWTIGCIVALIIGLTAWDGAAWQRLSSVPWFLLTAGAIGSCLVSLVAWLIPPIDAGPIMILMIVGQITGGLILTHFGCLAHPYNP